MFIALRYGCAQHFSNLCSSWAEARTCTVRLPCDEVQTVVPWNSHHEATAPQHMAAQPLQEPAKAAKSLAAGDGQQARSLGWLLASRRRGRGRLRLCLRRCCLGIDACCHCQHLLVARLDGAAEPQHHLPQPRRRQSSAPTCSQYPLARNTL